MTGTIWVAQRVLKAYPLHNASGGKGDCSQKKITDGLAWRKARRSMSWGPLGATAVRVLQFEGARHEALAD